MALLPAPSSCRTCQLCADCRASGLRATSLATSCCWPVRTCSTGWNGSCRQARRRVDQSARLFDKGPALVCTAALIGRCIILPRPAPPLPGLQWTVHPWVDSSCNQLRVEDQLRGLQIPDVHPADLVPGQRRVQTASVHEGGAAEGQGSTWAIWGRPKQQPAGLLDSTTQHSLIPASCASCDSLWCSARSAEHVCGGFCRSVRAARECRCGGREESAPLPGAKLLAADTPGPAGPLCSARLICLISRRCPCPAPSFLPLRPHPPDSVPSLPACPQRLLMLWHAASFWTLPTM